jgi:hypothetical protein
MEEGWIKFLEKANWLIQNGYPVPTTDPEELAKLLAQKDKNDK